MTNNVPPVKVALILDDTVIDVLYTDDRLAAILLSSPTVVDATDTGPEPIVGWSFDGEKLVKPQS